MDLFFNLQNLKSSITFFHLLGLAFGLGGALILDILLLREFGNIIHKEQLKLIATVSRLVTWGLVILWLSGLSFIAYYYLFTPEYLYNEKVWAKVVVVSVLTLNGYFVHSVILPALKRSMGKKMINALSYEEMKSVFSIGTVSFVSWFFPTILGVAKTLNFSVQMTDIVSAYLAMLLLAILFSNLMLSMLTRRKYLKI
jgi:hypothetical protein